MTPDTLRKLVAQSCASPSVHNVQPARWRIDGDTLWLLEDPKRRLVVGDPRGNDAALSLGATAEGLSIAASVEGYATAIERCEGQEGDLRMIARFRFSPATERDPYADVLSRRASWRGAFHSPTSADISAAQALASEECSIITNRDEIGSLAKLYDRASYGFLKDDAFRAELRSWMRLRKSHPRWTADGLNADAMKLSGIEAVGAGFVLGPLFRMLCIIGLAPSILAEAKSFGNATGIALFHRPQDEDPFESGRHFHRCWLAIESAGFGANVLAALADDEASAAKLCRDYEIPGNRRLVSAFRFGRRDGAGFTPARLPLNEVLLD